VDWLDELQSRSGALLALKAFVDVFQDKLLSQPHLLRPTALFCVHVMTFVKQYDELTGPALTNEVVDEGCWLKALLFDSWYDEYKGVICMLSIINGRVRKGLAAGDLTFTTQATK
jgi:hypothetical protein